jgi:hypothetical protein
MVEKVFVRRRSLATIYYAVTAVFAGCKDSWMLVARKPYGWTPARELEPSRLDAVLEVGLH